jgi:hypothetical protein
VLAILLSRARYYTQQYTGKNKPRDDEGFVSVKTCMSPILESPSSTTYFSKPSFDANFSKREGNILHHDPTLTAFTQLGAFKLQCNRALISLIDSKNQYILSEATKNVSLRSPHKADSGDGLFLGTRVLDRAWGICPQTIENFQDEDSSMERPDSLSMSS